MSVEGGAEPGCLMVVKAKGTAWIFPAVIAFVLFAIFAGVAASMLSESEDLAATIGGLVVIGGIFGSGAIACVLWAWAVMRARLEVYEWGMIRRHAFGTARLAFAEVETITLPAGSAIGVEPIGASTWRGRGGKLGLRLLPMKECLEAARFAASKVAPRLAQEMANRLKAGETLTFGNLAVTRESLSMGGKTVAWRELDRMNMSPEGMRIFPHDRPEQTIVVRQGTPNVYVLPTLGRIMLESAPATAATIAPPPSFTGAASGARVGGFPDMDPMLGAIVCGRSKAKQVALIALAFALFGGLALIALLWIPWWATLVLELAIAAWCARLAMRAGFAVYERGLKTPAAQIRWEEAEHLTYHVVDQYTNGAYTGRNISLRVEGNGTKIFFGGTGAANEGICDAILDRLMPPLIERRWKELQAGGEVKVGKLVLKRASVSWKRDEIPLSQVQAMEPRKGWLHVWRRDKPTSWAMVNLGATDARVAMLLLDRLLKEPQQAAATGVAARR